MEACGILSDIGPLHMYRGPVDVLGSYHELAHAGQ